MRLSTAASILVLGVCVLDAGPVTVKPCRRPEVRLMP